MKKFFGLFLCFAAAATVFYGCNSDDDKIDGGTPDAPVIKLVNGDIDAVQQIVTGMTVKVQVAAPGGIASFLIDIDSPALTPEELGSLGLAAQMDLANPASEEMAAGLSPRVSGGHGGEGRHLARVRPVAFHADDRSDLSRNVGS